MTAQIETLSSTVPDKQIFHSLNGLRFFLAIWIAYFHVGHMFDEGGFGKIPLLELGIARVDVFFVLSGFVLSHVYWAQRKKPFNYLDFMVARFARIYPMYVLAMLLIAFYLFAGALLGKHPDVAYPVVDFFRSMFFLQAFGLTDTNSWNFPAWAVSAEMGGYILFPIFIWLADRTRKTPLLLLAIAIAGVFVVEIFLREIYDQPMHLTTTSWGFLRGASVMFCGVAARALLNVYDPGVKLSVATLLAGTSLVFASALHLWGVPYVGLGAAFIMIGFARLDIAKINTGFSTPIMQELGNWSYVIFILHAPIYTILVQILAILGIEFVATPLSSLGFMLTVVAVSGPVYHLIEKPARTFIRTKWQNYRHHQIAKAGL